MKKSDTIVSILLIPIDYFVLVLAGITAYFLRFETFITEYREIYYKPSFEEYLNVVFFVAGISIIVFAILGLYAINGIRQKKDEIAKIFAACSTSITAALLIAIFFKIEIVQSRFIILAVWILAILFIIIARMIVRFIQSWFYKMGYGAVPIAVIGNDKATYELLEAYNTRPSFGYKVVKHFKDYNDKVRKELIEMFKKRKIEQVVKADTNIDKGCALDLIDLTTEYNIIFKFAADLFNTQTTHTDIATYAGVPIIEIKKTRLEGWGKIVKRIIDITGALILIIITSPIMILEAIAVKINSKGPVFFKYKRVGQYGKAFTYFKFRSMYHGTHELRFKKDFQQKAGQTREGPLLKFKKDPRITPVGRFIRKFSIDEFPEFFNVLIGKMSLVGPRPHEIEEVEKYKKQHKRVLDIKPGITGIPQVSGRSDLDFDEEVRLDTYYIENWSILMDFWLLFKTPFIILFKKRKAL
jgi:exopolysaccharide biosynthesis polyprenyl glycosylphosphotransferase